jgi:uncharacterized protein (DUF2336 family)
MSVQTSLIAELENAVKAGTRDKRVETLRRVTDLFLDSADRFNDAQIDLFDDVLSHLIRRMETRALSELSKRLAPVENAPPEAIRILARDDAIVVAGPVLAQSARLTSEDLIDIAQTKSRAHLLAISERTHLEEDVTDALLSRADGEIANKLAKNAGARFSDTGFTTLIKHAEADERLAKRIGLRLDLPLRLLRQLLLIATEAVRSWLLINAPHESKAEIERVVTSIANELSKEATAPRDFSRAQDLVAAMQQRHALNEAALINFAESQKYEEMVAALTALTSAPLQIIAAVVRSSRHDGILVACKAAKLKWRTVEAILKFRFSHHEVSDLELAQAKADFIILSQITAERTLRFWKAKNTLSLSNGAARYPRATSRRAAPSTQSIKPTQPN